MSIRSSAIGLAVIVVLMGAGAAQSLTGTNTVDSGDIVEGTIKHSDVKQNSIGGSRLLDNSVTGPKVANGTIGGADVADNSLKGADVDESMLSLPQVRQARVGVDGFNNVISGFDGATQVTRVSEGVYLLTFDSSVAGCVGAASPGLQGLTGNQVGLLQGHAGVKAGLGEPNQLEVHSFLETTPADTSFGLLVICD